MGIGCEVIAPSLIPKAPGDQVKTDKRDCQRLARLHHARELVAIRVPTPLEEAVRDLCRTRGDMVEDLTRARHRLTKFLLRHSRVYRGGSAWTVKHESWLVGQHFDEPALRLTRPYLWSAQGGGPGDQRNSANAASTASAGTERTTSSPSGPSSTKVKPSPVAFLSRPITSTSSPRSAPAGRRDGKS